MFQSSQCDDSDLCDLVAAGIAVLLLFLHRQQDRAGGHRLRELRRDQHSRLLSCRHHALLVHKHHQDSPTARTTTQQTGENLQP